MDTRERIRDWMLAVMSRHGWSAEHWGRIAKTSPTNITRFLKADAGFIPSAPTIAKLAAVAGTQPQLYGETDVHLYRVPILDAITPSLFQSPALAQEIARMSKEATAHVTVPFEVSEGSFAVRCPSANLSALGIARGDMLIVDPTERQDHGALVVYVTLDGLEAGQIAGGSIISQAGNAPKEPDQVDQVVVLGRIVQHIRRL